MWKAIDEQKTVSHGHGIDVYKRQITTNAVGGGLRPQSKLNWRRLGISKQAARDLQDQIEQVWEDWTPTADVRGMLHFEDMQLSLIHI